MTTWTHSPNEVSATWTKDADEKSATWSQLSGEESATWTRDADEKSATWTQSSGEQSAAWLHTGLMQYGFLAWEGIDYNWEDTMAYVDDYSASQQVESSGKWEDLG
tara:strand:- start:73 stop:390 length:318 start_codon:yes stop_codon:yes gene_type:complete